jgi:BlaI family penicillinase repressor
VEQLSDVQLAFMRALWAQPGASVVQVKEFLTHEGRELAPTTVATQLGRL